MPRRYLIILVLLVAGTLVLALSLGPILDKLDPGRELYEDVRVNALRGDGRCEEADQILEKLMAEYPRSRYVSRARDEVAECYCRRALEFWWGEGDPRSAIEGVEMVMDRFSGCDYASRAENWILQIYLNLSLELLEMGEYEEAVDTLEGALERYPGHEDVERVKENIEFMMFKHAEELADEGRYSESFIVLDGLLKDYPDTSAAEVTVEEMVVCLYDWGLSLQEEGGYEEALGKFGLIIDGYPDMYLYGRDGPSGDSHDLAREASVSCRYGWAGWLREKGDYGGAMERYLDLLDDDRYGKDVIRDVPATCFEWAADLEEQGRFEEALEKYGLVVDNYSSYPYPDDYVSKAEESKPGCYYEWVSSLISEGRYDEALDKYSLLLDEYPDSEYASEEASGILGGVPSGVLYAFASRYRDAEDYDLAIILYKAVTNFSPGSAEGRDAERAAIETEIEKIYREKHGELPPPCKEADKELGGNCELVVINDTPYELTVLMKGPETRSIVVDASPNSSIRVIPPMVFQRPPPEAERTKTILIPGSYEVAAKVSDPNVIPFYGEWSLEKDSEYSRWLYIIRTF